MDHEQYSQLNAALQLDLFFKVFSTCLDVPYIHGFIFFLEVTNIRELCIQVI